MQRFNILPDDRLEISDTDGIVLNVDHSLQFYEKCSHVRKNAEIKRSIHIDFTTSRRFSQRMQPKTIAVVQVPPWYPLHRYTSAQRAQLSLRIGLCQNSEKQSDMMSEAEKEACASPRCGVNGDASGTPSTNKSRGLLIAETLSAKKRRIVEQESTYINCSFIVV